MASQKGLYIIHLNARSLFGNVALIKPLLADNKVDNIYVQFRKLSYMI